MDHFKIVKNSEEITFHAYMNRLNEIARDCGGEIYFAEIFMPFLRMCSPDDAKIIPIFDDRLPGPKTKDENKRDTRERMNIICALNEDESYSVPDYIYVSTDYTFKNPQKPYLMVETKEPIFLKEQTYYRDLKDYIDKYKKQLKAQINSCGCVIFTDGITWMFLVDNGEDGIKEHPNYKTIQLLNMQSEKYYSTYKSTRKFSERQIDLSFIAPCLSNIIIKDAPQEWNILKARIKKLVNQQIQKDNHKLNNND